jgi:hypothetical protein
MKFTVGAASGYAAKLEGVTITISGTATTSASGILLTLKRTADGVTVATTTLTKQTTAEATANFPSASFGYYAKNEIPAGTTYEYQIVADATALGPGADVTIRFTIKSATDVTWHDGAVSGITSSYIKTFPAEGISLTLK